MHLRNVAATAVINISPSDTVDKAIALMEEHDIHHLPVVSDGQPVGIVSDRDLLRSVGWMITVDRTDLHDGEIIGPRFVSDVMSSPLQTLEPDDHLEAAARLMLREKIGAVALVSNAGLVGLVAESDILKCLTDDHERCGSSNWRSGKVAKQMSANVFSLNDEDPIVRATRLMKDKGVRHIPVLNRDYLVGIVSDRDIRKACFLERMRWLKGDHPAERMRGNLRDVMSHNPVSIIPSATLEYAASRLLGARIGGLPVVDHGRLCGIITETDLLHAFLHAPIEKLRRV